ncbi:MAG: BON domain-containing protein [Gammaproteobacteria bacterium RIFCSPLOWO2_02_FULL_61_13]|nr:MAG: BON domain-containing protein [Gammaproteobacteria bacterium RIFCSPLOWO2_02_FULL_61_13]
MRTYLETTMGAVLLAALVLLQGCVAVAAGGAVAGASAAVDRRTTGTLVEDESIELKAVRAIMADKDLNSQSHLNVTSYNTVVLLTGETPTDELRQRAEQIARGVDKVTTVHNEITVAAPSSMMTRSSDTVITSKVKTKLLADKNIEGVNIKVVTENGVVYLMGLASRAEAERATEVARQTGGVQKVVKVFQYTD